MQNLDNEREINQSLEFIAEQLESIYELKRDDSARKKWRKTFEQYRDLNQN